MVLIGHKQRTCCLRATANQRQASQPITYSGDKIIIIIIIM